MSKKRNSRKDPKSNALNDALSESDFELLLNNFDSFLSLDKKRVPNNASDELSDPDLDKLLEDGLFDYDASREAPVSHRTSREAPVSHRTSREAPVSHRTSREAPVSHHTSDKLSDARLHKLLEDGFFDYDASREVPVSHSASREAPVSHSTSGGAPVSHSASGGAPVVHHTSDALSDPDLIELLKKGIFDGKLKPPPIKTVKDCIISENPLLEMLTIADKKLLKTIFGIKKYNSLETSIHFGVRGNGFCGVNAFMAIATKLYPSLSSKEYQGILEIVQEYLLEKEVTNTDPNDIQDEHVVYIIRNLCSIFNIEGANIVIISLNPSQERNIIFDHRIDEYKPENTFILLHKDGHYSGVFLEDKVREDVLWNIFRFYTTTYRR